MFRKLCVAACLCALGAPAFAQTNNPPSTTQVEPMDTTPVYRVNVVSRSTKAVNYRHRSGATKVDFRGTDLEPQVTGNAKVDSKSGRLTIDANLEHLQSPRNYGPEYLTYVLWAITPQGRPVNLGEVLPNKDGKASLQVTTDLQAFGMIVTAEPYFAVTRPSNLVVAENIILGNTKGWEQPISAKYDLLQRGEYTVDIPAAQLPATRTDNGKKVPLELLEARNAVAIAKASGAQQYAPDALSKSQEFLSKGEDYLQRKQGDKAIGTVARGATQAAEDARLLAIRRREDERIAEQHRAEQERTAQAQAAAEAETSRRQQAEADKETAEQARLQAEQARQEAEAATARAQQERAQADAARTAALQQQQQLAAQAQQAQLNAQRAEQEREQMRARLLTQLNQVLQTRDSARGLIVNMSDVLFDFNKATLKPGARERLAKVAGIILAYPDLHLQIEGHTDNIGSDRYNQELSERRAATVRDYLVSQGVSIQNVMAQGLGKNEPVATNTTAAGRQLNRRVDLIVQGEAIGTAIGPAFRVNDRNANGNTGGTTGAAAGSSAGVSTAPVQTAPNTVGSPSAQPPTARPQNPSAPTMTPGPATQPQAPVSTAPTNPPPQ